MRDYLFKSLNESLGKRMNESVTLIGDLEDYKPWSGAEDTWYKIIDADKKEALDNYLKEMYPEGISIGDLNDLLWFDGDKVLRDLGLAEYPKDVEVEVKNIKFAEDVDPDDVSEATTVDITIESEGDNEGGVELSESIVSSLKKGTISLKELENANLTYEVKDEFEDDGYKGVELEIADKYGNVKVSIITWDDGYSEVYKGNDRIEEYEDLDDAIAYVVDKFRVNESSKLDDIDAKADDKKETAKKDFEKSEDDADADRDDEKKELNEEGGKSDVKGFVKEMKEVIPSDQINTYESDLYVLVTPKSKELLKKYNMYGNDLLSVFTDNIDHKRYFNIPFGNLGGYLKQRHGDDYGIVNANESLNESVDKSGLVNFIKKAIDAFKGGYDGTYYFKLGDADDGTEIYYVLGWQETSSYEEDDVKNHMVVDDSGNYSIHGKVAINIDDLQSDYDWDWYMPSHKDGEVENTDVALYTGDDVNNIADEAIDAFNRFKGYSFGEDAVIEE